jgi:glycosyltransferase involved in cell wall biosynthesis
MTSVPAGARIGAEAGGESGLRRRLRVGFIMSTEVGLKTQLLNWQRGLTEDLGVDPEWVVITWWQDGGFIERLKVVPAAVRTRLRALLQLRRGLNAGPFDALFISADHALWGGYSQLARQPYFMTLDSTILQQYDFGELYGKRPSRYAPIRRQKHQQKEQLYRRATALFPWSEWAAQSLIDDYRVNPHRVHVMPPGVDVEMWSPPEHREEDGTTDILFVGGDFYRKGGDMLLNWARGARGRHWRLHMVTREAVSPPNDRVFIYNGLSSNDERLIRLYRQADLFVLPTRGDCYSIASIEAMACGLPVILSRTGGTGDVIKDGQTGYLIPPGDQDALSDRLNHLVSCPEERIRMGRAARTDVLERYDARKNVARTIAIMREAAQA